MPAAHTIAEAKLAIWNVVTGISQMPATSGTDARRGPKKRPTNTPNKKTEPHGAFGCMYPR